MEVANQKYLHSEVVHNMGSPRVIVPFIMQLLNPSSVADIGCGTGTFLNVFKELGVESLVGVDGHWVKREQLHIEEANFVEADLEKPIILDRQFDLVLCLEVAEHLSGNSADTIVSSLVSLGKVICFSAAVTLQGGQNHLNEQPFSYWQQKFANHKYYFYDVFRGEFWKNENVDWWYKQNMFLIIHESVNVSDFIAAKKVYEEAEVMIHPDLLSLHVKQKINALEKVLYLKDKLQRIRSGEEIWKIYGSMLFKKLKKSF